MNAVTHYWRMTMPSGNVDCRHRHQRVLRSKIATFCPVDLLPCVTASPLNDILTTGSSTCVPNPRPRSLVAKRKSVMACIVLARPHAHQVQTIGHLPVRWCCTGDVQAGRMTRAVLTGTPECPAGHTWLRGPSSSTKCNMQRPAHRSGGEMINSKRLVLTGI